MHFMLDFPAAHGKQSVFSEAVTQISDALWVNHAAHERFTADHLEESPDGGTELQGFYISHLL